MARTLVRAVYRVRQFLRGLRAAIQPHEAAEVRALLNDGELRLFLAMQARDRRQAVDVMHWLRERGEPSGDLLRASLVHDVGKRDLWVRDRVAFVLIAAVSHRLLDRLASERGARWRRALWTLRHHARLGAERLAEAGSHPRVVELVAGHTGDAGNAGDDAELSSLIEADGAC